MSNRLEAYLEDLRGRLVRHFEPKRLDDVIAEMRSHVTYSARDAQQELGLASDDAVRCALVALGPVETVAEDLVRQYRGGTSKSLLRVAWMPVALYFATFALMPLLLVVMSVSTHPSALAVFTYLPTLVLITFCIAVWRSRRWLLMPMLGAIVTTIAFSALVARLPGYQDRVLRGTGWSAQAREKRLKELAQELRMTDLGAKGYLEAPWEFRRGDSLYLFPEEVQNTSYTFAPFLPIVIPYQSAPLVTLEPGVWSRERADNWDRHRLALQSRLQEERSILEDGHWPGVYMGWRFAAYRHGLEIGMLAFTNLAVLAASNRRRRRRARRDAHLA